MSNRWPAAICKISGRLVLLWAAALFLAISGPQAATYTWVGGGSAGNRDWSYSQNWDAGVAPANDGTASILFGESLKTTSKVDADWNVFSLTFAADAGSYTLVDEDLTIQNGISNWSSSSQEIRNEIRMGAAQTWNASTGNLVFQGEIQNEGFALTLAGAADFEIRDEISGSGGLILNGQGTVAFFSAAEFTGDIELNSGTLLLAKNNVLDNDADLILGGGTLATGGHDETMGQLTLLADSILDMGDLNSVLRFANSSEVSWNSVATLFVHNWSEPPGGDGGDHFFVAGENGTGLTQGQISQIFFVDPYGANSGLYSAQILPSGEIVPFAVVPETSTVLALAFVGLAAGLYERKRLLALIS
jgi:hypothetical protein